MNRTEKELKSENGLIKFGVKILIAILILSFLGFSLRDLVESETTQDNFGYLGELFTEHVIPFYNSYLSPIVNFIISFIKDSFIIFQEYINNPSDLPLDVPQVNR